MLNCMQGFLFVSFRQKLDLHLSYGAVFVSGMSYLISAAAMSLRSSLGVSSSRRMCVEWKWKQEGKCVVVGGKSKGILRSREVSLRSF